MVEGMVTNGDSALSSNNQKLIWYLSSRAGYEQELNRALWRDFQPSASSNFPLNVVLITAFF